ncbi:MAG: hypothetical protein ACXVA3_16780 [Vulcanimicrobiaceae bacterium]
MPRLNQLTLIACPFSAAMDFVERFFSTRKTLVVQGAAIFHVQVVPAFELVPDRSDFVRRHDALRVVWKPLPHEKLLPSFHAVITVRPHGRQSALRIRGYYQPPLGRFGRLFDRVIGRLIARTTVRALAQQIKEYVASSWSAERASYPNLSTLNTR